MNSVEDLDVFKLAHRLALKIYSATKKFPKGETFSLAHQMRRAAASVGANLLEGSRRLSSKEYRQFAGIAGGSAGEICYHLLLAKDLEYISHQTYQELRSGYDRVVKMLWRLAQTLSETERTR
jgi:four helix bundle protein